LTEGSILSAHDLLKKYFGAAAPEFRKTWALSLTSRETARLRAEAGN
jgi:hypothetical protein